MDYGNGGGTVKIEKFAECNVTYGENQPEYLPLPAHRASDGTVTSCWKASLRERLKILLTGRVYLQLLTFQQPIQPQLLLAEKPELEAADEAVRRGS